MDPPSATDDQHTPESAAETRKRPYRIGLLANGDPDDVRTWSGVPNSIQRELRKRFDEVVYVPSEPAPWTIFLKRVNHHLHRFTGKRFIAQWSAINARLHAKKIRARLKTHPVDALLAITVDQQIACLKNSPVPIIHHSDTTARGIENYYPAFSDLWGFARRNGERITRGAIHNATLSVYPARWSADSAINDYGADPSTIHAVPYGANLKDPPTREEAIDCTPRDRCRMLWIGVEWDRKGGQLTYDTMVELNNRGIDAEMVVVGAQPPEHCDHPNVTSHGFLNKQVPEQLATYESLWKTAAFFMLPSRGETFGAVFCEAAANGLPSVSTATGGVPDAVAHGESGLLLPLDAGPAEYADAMAALWNDRLAYEKMVQTSRDRYENLLNWDAWADAVTELIVDAIEKHKSKA
ncbi:MAG: glycosyltransferase family 4 protein [Planctomycetota bacterium]